MNNPRERPPERANSKTALALNDWIRLLEVLRNKINVQSYETWLRPTRFLKVEDNCLFVQVPTDYFQHIGERYEDSIREGISSLGLRYKAVKFVPRESSVENAVSSRAGDYIPLSTYKMSGPKFSQILRPQLNKRYQFDGFVIGSGNQFAVAAAKAVAGNPSNTYSPLLLYGSSGIGKTHLLHSIGNEVVRMHPTASICFTSGETFANEMIQSVRNNKMSEFRARFRSVDVLLIDDIQALAGKPRTQEEFFHTFNALHEGMKQIVIASDCPPKELPDFDERIRSRFEWGLTADIQPPELETKVAILQRYAESELVELPSDVALFIASNVRTNVRELEGALVRLIAWCAMHGVEITLAVAQQCLKQFIDTQVRKISIESIQRAVAMRYRLSVPALKKNDRSRTTVLARQIAMYLAKHLTRASLPEIGRHFGNMHHSTVMHSVTKIADLIRTDKKMRDVIEEITGSLT